MHCRYFFSIVDFISLCFRYTFLMTYIGPYQVKALYAAALQTPTNEATNVPQSTPSPAPPANPVPSPAPPANPVPSPAPPANPVPGSKSAPKTGTSTGLLGDGAHTTLDPSMKWNHTGMRYWLLPYLYTFVCIALTI